MTLRAGGTSLNGQAQGDGILVDVRRHFDGVEVEDEGRRGAGQGRDAARARQPGARAARAQARPRPGQHRHRDCVGGVIANNSGGMRCGTTADSYSTVRELTFVLPSGTTIDTGARGRRAGLRARPSPSWPGGWRRSATRSARRRRAERARSARKFEIKNTTGYRLCAFLDADTPLEIFRRLLVGSEGTLAFIAEAVFETVPQPPHTTISWLHFDGIESATEPVPGLRRRRAPPRSS